jgi:RNA polymerase sigma factor (sigma-70 family)
MTYALDILVRRAQEGDERALELLLGALRGPLLRYARRIGAGASDAEDVVQETLVDVVRGLDGYRWQASFLSWSYAILSRRAARHARTCAALAVPMVEQLERTLSEPEDPLSPGETVLVEQDAHLACAFVVACQLGETTRRAYLLGEVLGVTDAVGAEVCGTSRAAFRKRVSRARQQVGVAIRAAMAENGSAPTPADVDGGASRELDLLVRLGELHRATGRRADAPAALRAAATVAPGLLNEAGGLRGKVVLAP